MPLRYNDLVSQLLNPPDTSRNALERAAATGLSTPPSEAEVAVAQAKSYVSEWLQPAFCPPLGTAFIAFPKEEGGNREVKHRFFDVVRAHYRAKDNAVAPEKSAWIEIAQSRHVFTLRIKGARLQERSIKDAIDRIFLQGEQVRPLLEGREGEVTFGRHANPIDPETREERRIDPDWPHWIDFFSWWSEPGEFGFLLIKATGGPTREVIGPSEELNVTWFD